jgi:L-threonylcarbamoyladenylate synthase
MFKTEVKKIDCDFSLLKAAELILDDELVAFPTETVYGLGANALSEAAVAKIFQAKGRPSDNPLIVHVSSMEMLENLLKPDAVFAKYLPAIEKYWPGPLTILLPKPSCIPLIVTAGNSTVAIRMPAHKGARKLIEAAGVPLAAPSANKSGRPSPTSSEHVMTDLQGEIPLILDGGFCKSGIESTVLDCLGERPTILRPGSVTAEMLISIYCDLLVYQRDFVDPELELIPTTPGMKYRHYSPDAEVILVDIGTNPLAFEIQRRRIFEEYQQLSSMGKLVGLLHLDEPVDDITLCYSLGSSAADAAKNLFAGLRKLEELGADCILVQGLKTENEGMAVMNRICKASDRIIK